MADCDISKEELKAWCEEAISRGEDYWTRYAENDVIHFCQAMAEIDYDIDSYSDARYSEYRAEIESWDWPALQNEANDNYREYITEYGESGDANYSDFGNSPCSAYLGSVLSLAPSGKFYMLWTSNQNPRDIILDAAFYSALDDVAEEHGAYIENGEGDPCDLFVAFSVPESE